MASLALRLIGLRSLQCAKAFISPSIKFGASKSAQISVNPWKTIQFRGLSITSSTIDFRQSTELSSCRVNTPDGKKYYVDLKELQADQGTKFVKISELSNGKRSSLIIGAEDVPEVLAKLESYTQKDFNCDNDAAQTTEITSKTFPDKSYVIVSNPRGGLIIIREVRNERYLAQVFIYFDGLQLITDALRTVTNL